MLNLLKALLIKAMPEKIHRYLTKSGLKKFYSYSNITYAQEGEDLVLLNAFEFKKDGFYVDIGAYHPLKFSNTYLLYKRGWRGVNIDARPGSMDVFNQLRPLDVNLEVAISETEEELTYYMFDEPALNSFSKELSLDRDQNTIFRIKQEIKVKTQTLKKVLGESVQNKPIDVMSIDVEGLEMNVLKSNDWNLYRPKMLLVELLDCNTVDQVYNSAITRYLRNYSYEVTYIMPRTVFYRLQK